MGKGEWWLRSKPFPFPFSPFPCRFSPFPIFPLGCVPLLAVEISHAVAQGLDLDATSGAWPKPLRTLDATLPAELPGTIVASIRVSFRCLSRDAQTALAAALDELEWRHWLVAEPRGYAFRARIVRDVVARDMVTEGQRRRILDA
jgi:hypothetical protein